MSQRIPPLLPWSLSRLLKRIAHEWDERGEIFSLARRRFFDPAGAPDLSCRIGDTTVATPVGPAAGPHTQLAQNLVLGWLAGARSFELKTVQILDELDIERPCIDMQNVGYNIEWSQELTLAESLREYVKAWLLLGVLRRWEPLREVITRPGDHVFELSVGYDLAGIQSEPMTTFIDGLRDARVLLDELRPEIGGPFAGLRDIDVPGRIVDTATISTFHGCPPDEVEGIVKHLMTRHDLDVTVKLNPTLLGLDRVRTLLHDGLGYRDVTLVPEAFAEDLQFDRAIELIGTLREFAARQGRTLGIKLTNTLVVANTCDVMPGERMYLSGKPLHVLAIDLLDRLQDALPGVLDVGAPTAADAAAALPPVPVAFSAGIDKDNLAQVVGLGLVPVTICSDLLRPGGYGRMAQGLRKLAKTMTEAGCADLAAWRKLTAEQAQASGKRDAVAALAAELTSVDGSRRYGLAATDKPLRQVDTDLQVFDCVACGNCVTVCPNNAFFQSPTPEGLGLEARNQYFVLAELCNECGNCTTFCPERGAPHRIKPRLYTDADNLARRDDGGFLVTASDKGSYEVSGPAEAASAAHTIGKVLRGTKGSVI